MFSRLSLLTFLTPFFVLIFAGAAAGEPGNAMCPVMLDEAIDPEHHLVYKGREIHFCCSTCIQDFKKDPAAYIARLPQFSDLVERDSHALSDSKVPPRSTAWQRLKGTVIPAGAGTLIAVLGALFLVGRRPGRRALGVLTGLVFLFAGGLGLTALYARDANMQRIIWENRDRVHFATYYEFGDPPVPAHPDHKPRLGGIYYRGNDERNARLFNNGYYRTATLHLSIVDERGNEVSYGEDVTGRTLSVRLEIRRAPHTPDRFFSDKSMGWAFLTRDGSPFLGVNAPVLDRVALTELDPGQRWEALYPIGRVGERANAGFDLNTGTVEQLAAWPEVGQEAAEWLVAWRKDNNGRVQGPADLDSAGIEEPARTALLPLLRTEVREGIVYAAQEAYAKKDGTGDLVGARFHYGIKYALHLEEGRILPDSEAFMNALYRSRKVAAWKIPPEQWFDANPIPEKPDAGIDDPVLLGLDELIDDMN